MSKIKKRILNISLSIVGFVLLVGILFFAIEPGIPTTRLNSEGISTRCLSLPNGYYIGDSVLGFLDGEGTFEFDTGESYTGAWDNHNMNGEGTLTSTLGTYKGNFVNSERSGKGVFTWSDGAEYNGEWLSDKMNGKGKVTTKSGIVYDGTFNNNIFESGSIQLKNDVAEYKLTVSEGVLGKSIKVTFVNGTTYGVCIYRSGIDIKAV